jgi:hypothetical protein
MFCENWNIHQICISAPICQFCDFVRRLHANVAPTISSDSGKKLISIVSFSGGFFSENLAAVSCAVTSCRALCATFLCRLVTKQTQGAPFYAPCSGCDPCARARSLRGDERAGKRESSAEKVKQNTFSEECLAWHPRRSQRERERWCSASLSHHKSNWCSRAGKKFHTIHLGISTRGHLKNAPRQ